MKPVPTVLLLEPDIFYVMLESIAPPQNPNWYKDNFILNTTDNTRVRVGENIKIFYQMLILAGYFL